MATPGRKPIPSNVHRLHGNPGKRRLNDREPKPGGNGTGGGKPRRPKGLDHIARAEWDRMAPILHKLGTLTKIDHAVFESYCRYYSDWKRYQKLAEKAPVVMTKWGQPIRNPYINLAQDAFKNYKACATELGLTPSSRSRIKAEIPELEDELDNFMKRKK